MNVIMITNYKQMIEEFDKEFNKYYVGECIRDKKGQYFFKKDDIKSFIKSQYIQRIESEIENLPNEKMHLLPDDVQSPHETEHDRGWNEYRRTLVSHLQQELKAIKEDKI